MSEYNIQMHNYNGSSYDNLYPKTKSTIVIMNDGKTVEEAMASGGEFTADSIKLKVDGSYDAGWTVQDWYDGNIADPILDNNSFATIRQVSDAGTGASYWSVGDRKGVALSGSVGLGSTTVSLSGTYYMSILGFDHNKSYESSSSHTITFQFGWTALTGGTQIAFCSFSGTNYTSNGTGTAMNTSNTNVGGWSSSAMRSTICRTQFRACLPSDLSSVLKSVTKCTNTGNSGGSNTETSIDDIFLPSETEVFGSQTYSGTTANQIQYDYYKGVSAGSASKNAFAAASKIRYNHQSQSSAVGWWERSPHSSSMYFFCLVNGYGAAGNDYPVYSYGFAPCLCI